MPSKFMKMLAVSLTTLCMLLVYGLSPTWAGDNQTRAVKPSEGQTLYQMRQQVAQGTTGSRPPQPVPQPSNQAETGSQTSTSQTFYQSMATSVTEPGKFEMGIIGGDPLGLSAKLWLTPKRAIDAGLGWSTLGSGDNLELYADYLFHNFDVLKLDKGALPLYAGLGARVRFGEDSRFGFRVPLGVQYISVSTTISLFLEVAPIISFIPDAEVDFHAGIGIRFFFFE
jgi:hypothetical protein